MAIERYCQIRSAHGYDATLNSAEMWHSALLDRLLRGKEPLLLPPPRAHSYPWYDLIETGEGWCTEDPKIAGEAGYNHYPSDTVVINQSGQWKLIEKKTEKDWIIQCETNGQLFRCYERDDYPMWGYRDDGTVGELYRTGWRLERIEDGRGDQDLLS